MIVPLSIISHLQHSSTCRNTHRAFLKQLVFTLRGSVFLEMAKPPHKLHDNITQRRAAPLPHVKCGVQLTLEAMSPETGSSPTTTAEEPSLPVQQICRTGFCETETESHWSCNRKSRVCPPSEKQHPGKDVAALLKRIRIHPEAQRILGNSCIPVVSLELLNFRSVCLPSLQPVVSLVRLPCQTRAEPRRDAAGLDRPQQNGFSQDEVNVLEVGEVSPQSDLSQPEPTQTSWTEPCSPDSCPSEGPEPASGYDRDSNPDQPYILFDGPSDEWDPDGKSDLDTFYLDPDPEQTVVIELDPELEADQGGSLELEDEAEITCEFVQTDDGDDHRFDLCCSQEEPGPGSGAEGMESEDFCAVCLNGGDLLCCDRCPKVYHLACHIPALTSFPLGDWVCTSCRSDQEPSETYDGEDKPSCGGVQAPYTLSNVDQRRCEKLTLLLYCNTLSAPFHEPVSSLARNYYQIIKRPIDLSVIRRKLDKSNTLHYFTAEQFVHDVLLMFKNCATFNYPDSEVAQAGRSLELFFLSKLKEIFPERTFPSASQDLTDRARRRWLCRKRRENQKKKRYVFSGKKYYL